MAGFLIPGAANLAPEEAPLVTAGNGDALTTPTGAARAAGMEPPGILPGTSDEPRAIPLGGTSVVPTGIRSVEAPKRSMSGEQAPSIIAALPAQAR